MQETGHTEVIVKQLDLASFESIKELARDVNENESRLDVLINNAGEKFSCSCFNLRVQNLFTEQYIPHLNTLSHEFVKICTNTSTTYSLREVISRLNSFRDTGHGLNCLKICLVLVQFLCNEVAFAIY